MRDHRSRPSPVVPAPRVARGFSTGMIVGVLLGMLVGSAGISLAAFGFPGWQKFSRDFKVGYVTGFLDMSNLARNLEPGGWVDTKYPMVKKAKPMEWAAKIDELYKQPENQNYTVTSILQLAADKLQDKYGKEAPEERTRKRMQAQLDAIRKKREAEELAARAAGKTAAETKKVEPAPPSGKGVKLSDLAPKKKWCRCDGKDPKAARAARRAAAAAESGDQPTPAVKKPGAPAGATPSAK